MHVALVHHHVGGKAGGGGGVRLMLELGLGLQRRGHRVTVACHDYLPDSEFLYASEQLEIRSVREGISELPGSAPELARRYWLDMPKVARLVPYDADVVNAHEWLALRPGRIAARRLSVPLVWTRNDESVWERAIVPRQTIVGDPRPTRRALRAAMGWPDLLDARRTDAIAVLSAQQVEMVRRSYRKPAVVVPCRAARALLRPAGPRGGPQAARHPRRRVPRGGFRHPRHPPPLRGPDRGDGAAGGRPVDPRADRGLRPRRPAATPTGCRR